MLLFFVVTIYVGLCWVYFIVIPIIYSRKLVGYLGTRAAQYYDIYQHCDIDLNSANSRIFDNNIIINFPLKY